MLDLEETKRQVAGLRRALEEEGRDSSDLEISVSPRHNTHVAVRITLIVSLL